MCVVYVCVCVCVCVATVVCVYRRVLSLLVSSSLHTRPHHSSLSPSPSRPHVSHVLRRVLYVFQAPIGVFPLVCRGTPCARVHILPCGTGPSCSLSLSFSILSHTASPPLPRRYACMSVCGVCVFMYASVRLCVCVCVRVVLCEWP